MATIGQVLTTPEAGWRRYDDRDALLLYTGSTTQQTYNQHYLTTATYLTSAESEVSFKFIGTKLRIVGYRSPGRVAQTLIYIDGVMHEYTEQGADTGQVLMFEKLDLGEGVHTVRINAPSATPTNGASIDAVDIDSTGALSASVGMTSTAPEPGWRRYDSASPLIQYTGGTWTHTTSTGSFSSTLSYSMEPDAKIGFTFTGTKLRLIVYVTNAYTDECVVTIDGVSEVVNTRGPVPILQYLAYEKTGLTEGVHRVEMTNRKGGTLRLGLDAIDIDNTGFLRTYPATTGQMRSKVSEMEEGDYISCKYASPASLSEFGLSAAEDLPLGGATTGLFYFVKVAGGLLVADRVVNNIGITWQALNAAGAIEPTPLPPELVSISPILTGYTSSVSPLLIYRGDKAGDSSGAAWQAFDGKLAGGYSLNVALMNAIKSPTTIRHTQSALGFDWGEPRTVHAVSVTYVNAGNWNGYPRALTIQISHTGGADAEWVDVHDITGMTWAVGETKTFLINSPVPARYVRVTKFETNTSAATNVVTIDEVKFYEAVPTEYAYKLRSLTGGSAYASYPGSIPTMTSNTTTSDEGVVPGVASASGEYGANYEAWRALDGVRYTVSTNTYWYVESPSGWIMYQFNLPIAVSCYSISTINTSLGVTRAPKDWTFEGSHDGQLWTVLDTRAGIVWTAGQRRVFAIPNGTEYSYYRVNVSSTGGPDLCIDALEMFSRKASESIALPGTTDRNLGAWPTNNEWDKYISNFPVEMVQEGKTVDDVFHWSNASTWCQDSLLTNITASTYRVIRGRTAIDQFSPYLSSGALATIGFRPVLDYQE